MTTAARQKIQSAFFVLAGSASIFVAIPNAHAVSTFSLTTPSAENFTSKDFSVDGIILKLANPTGTGISPTLNTKDTGLCAYFSIATTGARCGSTTSGDSVNGFSLEFDKSVSLKQFNVSKFAGLGLSSIKFESGSNSKQFDFASTGIQSFDNPFVVSAGSIVSVTTAGAISTGSGIFRIADLQVELAPTASVPGPLPLLGAGVAFAYSRRLRSRILSKVS